MRVLGVVTARGGSKGIPRKNLRALGGKPLLKYTADAALDARRLSRVILSTDDIEIADLGRRCGLDVPFLRPAELALDDTPSIAVVQHAVRQMEQAGEYYDAVCTLQPTTPFRRAEHIDSCIHLLQTTDVDSVTTVLAVPTKMNPHWVYFQDDHGLLRLCTGETEPVSRRQDLPPAYHRDGSVYVTRREVLMLQDSIYGNRLYGYQLNPDESVNIDTPADWLRAEQMLRDVRSGHPPETTHQRESSHSQFLSAIPQVVG